MNKNILTLALLGSILLLSCKDEKASDPVTPNPIIPSDTVCSISKWSHGYNWYTHVYDENNRLIQYNDDEFNWTRFIQYDNQNRVSDIEFKLNGNLESKSVWSYNPDDSLGGDSLPYEILQLSKSGDVVAKRSYKYADGRVISNGWFSYQDTSYTPESFETYEYKGEKISKVITYSRYLKSFGKFISQSDFVNFTYDDKTNVFQSMFWYFYYNDFNRLPLGNNILRYEEGDNNYTFSYTYNVDELPKDFVSMNNGVEYTDTTRYLYECK